MRSIGLFGGSFNPIHVGHVALAKAALKACGLDEVWLMVSPQNPLKRNLALLDDQLRLEMAQKALDGVEGVKASDYEMHLPKPSYTWHTLQALAKDYPDYRFVNVSSTEIREKVKQGQSIHGLVPEAIEPLVRQYYG